MSTAFSIQQCGWWLTGSRIVLQVFAMYLGDRATMRCDAIQCDASDAMQCYAMLCDAMRLQPVLKAAGRNDDGQNASRVWMVHSPPVYLIMAYI